MLNKEINWDEKTARKIEAKTKKLFPRSKIGKGLVVS